MKKTLIFASIITLSFVAFSGCALKDKIMNKLGVGGSDDVETQDDVKSGITTGTDQGAMVTSPSPAPSSMTNTTTGANAATTLKALDQDFGSVSASGMSGADLQ